MSHVTVSRQKITGLWSFPSSLLSKRQPPLSTVTTQMSDGYGRGRDNVNVAGAFIILHSNNFYHLLLNSIVLFYIILRLLQSTLFHIKSNKVCLFSNTTELLGSSTAVLGKFLARPASSLQN